eukprot:TRINITY_DN4038_c0_g4_i1.p1 TRINITY_DN4038_c0_g4~~TRINITY_DN4038_c0_g4_i1.p1  ORF type:complete len:1329 (+),score=229.17 TRINITY_DN4038_c0_g4_i1:46-4032(+)
MPNRARMNAAPMREQPRHAVRQRHGAAAVVVMLLCGPSSAGATAAPSASPSLPPSASPSRSPSIPPSRAPSTPPSVMPSRSPSKPPSVMPSRSPSTPPSIAPTSPSVSPTKAPSAPPSRPPTRAPSLPPTTMPTQSPTRSPTRGPSLSPSRGPSAAPYTPGTPSRAPVLPPTASPSRAPTTSAPSLSPSTSAPSASPTASPSASPYKPGTPSAAPKTSAPTTSPTRNPTQAPSASPCAGGCVVNECSSVTACAQAGQLCQDPNTAPTSLSDWRCVCQGGGTGSATAQAATCTYPTGDDCRTYAAECSRYGQACQDPDTSVRGDWQCVCVSPQSGTAVTRGVASCAASGQTDECASTSVRSVCTAAGQICFDPDKSTANSWTCQCPGGSASAVASAVGSCSYDECTAICSGCADSGVGNVCTTVGQTCSDADQSATGQWKCTCKGGTAGVGEAVAGAAVCVYDECSASPCGSGQSCNDPNKVSSRVGDFICTCNGTSVNATGVAASCDECVTNPCGSGQTCQDSSGSGNFVCTCAVDTTVSKTGGPATCDGLVDECASNPCSMTSTAQTCTDPNKTKNGDYVCVCNEATGSGNTAVGRVASPCGSYTDECSASPCGSAQTCIDQNSSTTSTGDYVCTCTNRLGQNIGAAVESCSAPSPLPAPTPASMVMRFIYRFASTIARADYTAAAMLTALMRAINLLSTGANDPEVTVPAEVFNIRQNCWSWRSDSATCLPQAASERRASTAQVPTSDGEFELVVVGSNQNDIRWDWIEALRRSESELTANTATKLVGDPQVRVWYGATPAPATLGPTSSDDDDDSMEWWVILLIVLVCLLVCLLCVLLFVRWRRKEKKKSVEEARQREEHKKALAASQQGPEAAPSQDKLLPTSEQGPPQQQWSDLEDGAAGAMEETQPSPAGQDPENPNPIPHMFPPRPDSADRSPDGRDHKDASPSPATPPDTHVYGFGRNLEGQLGLGEGDAFATVVAPEELPELAVRGVSILACGSFHTIIVCTDATVLAFGEGGYGQLGLGGRSSPKTPVTVPFFRGRLPRMLACGEEHTLIGCDDGLFAFGHNENGQLGLGDTAERLLPERVPLFGSAGGNLSLVACGSHHSVVVYARRLYAFGWNRYGQLALGDDEDRLEPALVSFFDGMEVDAVACGVQHTVVLCRDGGLFTVGGNTYGQLGLGHQVNESIPQRVPYFDGMRVLGASAWFHTVVWCEGQVVSFGEGMHYKLGTDPDEEDPPNRSLPSALPYFTGRSVVSACAGSEHTMVLCEEGLYAWGNGDGGKLGHGDLELVTDPATSFVEAFRLHHVHVIGAGVDHTVAYCEPR